MIPVLTTKRLTLRAPCWDDFETYAAFRASPRAVTVGGPYPRGVAFDQFSALLGHWPLRGYGRWMVADRHDDTPLGIVGLYYPEDWPEPELAWSVFEAAEGRGVAQEAALAARSHAYDTLGWSRLISMIDATNVRSVALAKRLGCTQDGTYEHPSFGTMHYWRHPTPQEVSA